MPEETNRIEYKRELSDASDKFEKNVVSFLNNHEGGVIFIGSDGCLNHLLIALGSRRKSLMPI